MLHNEIRKSYNRKSEMKGSGFPNKLIDKLKINLPKHALTNVELSHLAKKLKITKFREVFMRDTLPQKIQKNACVI